MKAFNQSNDDKQKLIIYSFLKSGIIATDFLTDL